MSNLFKPPAGTSASPGKRVVLQGTAFAPGPAVINADGELDGGGGLGLGDMLSTNNLSDVASVSTARTNLGLGSVALLSAITEADLTLTDVTTANVSTSKHGFAPKAPNDATKYLDGTGAYSVPAGAGGGSWGSITGTLSDQTDLQTALDAKLVKASNLSDLVSASTARTNLGLGSAALLASSDVFQVANNLSEGVAATMRTNLGLGSAALLASSAVFQVANNLSEGTASTMRTNLGLGSAALLASSAVFQVSNNLSEGTAATMRTNLGLGAVALLSSVAEANLSISDNTTGNASTSAHGFLKKLDNNASNFMNGQGNWAAPSASLTVGSSAVGSGTSGRVLYDNAGTLGEYAVTGSGNAVLSTSPTLVTPVLGTPSSGDATNLTNIPVNNAKSGAVLPGLNGGGLVLLEQHSASSSASLAFTTCITSTYDSYLIQILLLIPATNLVDLFMRVSTNGGSSYDSGSNYMWSGARQTNATTSSAGSDGDSAFRLNVYSAGSVSSTTSRGGLSGFVNLHAPGNAASNPAINGITSYQYTGGGPVHITGTIGGAYLSTTAVNALQFLFSSGNIASGIIRVYGVAK